MSFKAILVLCAQALMIQSAFSQCTSRAAIDASGIGIGSPYGLAGPGFGPTFAGPGRYDGLGFAGRGLPCEGRYAPAMEFTATSGGSLPVTSSSAIAPTGISVVSENIFEGALSVAGELPFVGTTGMEGAMPSAGAGAINHSCGNGVNAMMSDSMVYGPGAIPPIAATFGPGAAAFGPGAATFGPGATAFGPAVSPSAFGPGPLARNAGLGGCGGNIIY